MLFKVLEKILILIKILLIERMQQIFYHKHILILPIIILKFKKITYEIKIYLLIFIFIFIRFIYIYKDFILFYIVYIF